MMYNQIFKYNIHISFMIYFLMKDFLMKDFFVHVYIDKQISLINFNYIKYFLVLLSKQPFYEKQLHVTNVFQKTIASFLFMLIYQHNDRLRCEPLLISHLTINVFQSCVHIIQFLLVMKSIKV
jgi:hypothetical protein